MTAILKGQRRTLDECVPMALWNNVNGPKNLSRNNYFYLSVCLITIMWLKFQRYTLLHFTSCQQSCKGNLFYRCFQVFKVIHQLIDTEEDLLMVWQRRAASYFSVDFYPAKLPMVCLPWRTRWIVFRDVCVLRLPNQLFGSLRKMELGTWSCGVRLGLMQKLVCRHISKLQWATTPWAEGTLFKVMMAKLTLFHEPFAVFFDLTRWCCLFEKGFKTCPKQAKSISYWDQQIPQIAP